MRKILGSGLMVLAIGAASTQATADWPHFLGPDRTGVSQETNLLETWDEQGPEEQWRVPVGFGFGGAAVRDDQVYLLDREGDERDVLRMLDLESGEEQWRFAYERAGRLSHHGSRSTPTVDEELVFTVGGFGDVYAVSRATGEAVWQTNLNEQFEAGTPNWGFAQSPLVHGDVVIVTPTHAQSPGLVAMDKATGEVAWESEAFGGDYYSSPDLRTVAGAQGVLLITNEQVTFVNPDDGSTIWKFTGYNNQFPIPSPTVLDDEERIFITGGYGGGSVMIRVTESGDGYDIEELFRLEGGAQLHPAIQHGDHLYLNLNENATLRRDTMRLGGLACLDTESGEIVWRTGEDPNFDRGSLMLADGKLIVLDGQNGRLHMANPTPEGYEEIAQARVFNPDRPRGNNIWAPMALSDGKLIVRDQNEMVCLDLRAPAQASR